MKYTFQIITIVLLIISWTLSKEKTGKALKIALRRFLSIAPLFIFVILLTSLMLGFISPESIQNSLGSSSNRWAGTAIGAAIGSIAIMPGFVAFPLGGILLKNGVPYMIISSFTTCLMMVGIITFPIEKAFLGTRVALFRNIAGLFIAIIVAIITGIVFGEVFS